MFVLCSKFHKVLIIKTRQSKIVLQKTKRIKLQIKNNKLPLLFNFFNFIFKNIIDFFKTNTNLNIFQKVHVCEHQNTRMKF